MPNAGDLIRATDIGGDVGCRIRRAAAQSVNNTTATSISWDTEDQDTDGFITVTSATVTIPSGLGGLYAITAHMVCAISEAGGVRDFISIEVTSSITGMPVNFRNAGEAAAEDMMDISVTIPLNAGDSFVVQVFHSTGAAVNFTGWLACYRIAAF